MPHDRDFPYMKLIIRRMKTRSSGFAENKKTHFVNGEKNV